MELWSLVAQGKKSNNSQRAGTCGKAGMYELYYTNSSPVDVALSANTKYICGRDSHDHSIKTTLMELLADSDWL